MATLSSKESSSNIVQLIPLRPTHLIILFFSFIEVFHAVQVQRRSIFACGSNRFKCHTDHDDVGGEKKGSPAEKRNTVNAPEGIKANKNGRRIGFTNMFGIGKKSSGSKSVEGAENKEKTSEDMPSVLAEDSVKNGSVVSSSKNDGGYLQDKFATTPEALWDVEINDPLPVVSSSSSSDKNPFAIGSSYQDSEKQMEKIPSERSTQSHPSVFGGQSSSRPGSSKGNLEVNMSVVANDDPLAGLFGRELKDKEKELQFGKTHARLIPNTSWFERH